MLYEVLHRARIGGEEEKLEIISKFHPLINKYARKLERMEYEDTYSELVLKLLEIIQNARVLSSFECEEDEGKIVSYISESIYHQYVALSKSTKVQDYIINFSRLSD